MTLPAQVRKQSEAVQQLYAEMEGEATPIPVANEPVAPQSETHVEPKPAPVKTAPAVTADSEDKTLLQKYRTLQGMYNAEIPRLHSQLRDRDADLQDMQNRVAQLENLLSSAQSEQPASTSKTSYVTDADRAEYGDAIEVMRRAAREEAAAVYEPRIAQLSDALAQIQGFVPRVEHVERANQAASVNTFWSNLTEFVPNWQQVNDSKEFKEWLMEVDPVTGRARQVFLKEAQDNLDAPRVAEFFELWAQISGSNAPIANPTPQPRARPTQLERQVAPGKSKASAPASNQPKVYSRQNDIASFYKAVRQGKYIGREAEKAALEADIVLASQEGRITP